ncbi:SAAL1 isoform 8, partial [Pan troglodytes]
PPGRDKEEEEEVAGGDCIGSTVYSKHWLFGVLSGLIQIVSPENTKSSSDDEEQLTDLDEEMENEICRALTKETVAQGVKEGQLSKQKCSSAFQNLLPFYSPVVEDFIKILREVDKALADDLEKNFPSLKVQT